MRISKKVTTFVISSLLALLVGSMSPLAAAKKAEKKQNKHETSSSSSHRKKECTRKLVRHNIQLQLFDANGYAVENTAFWVTLKLQRDHNRVFMSVPGINFETGQFAADNVIEPGLALLAPQITRLSGGTLRTVDGFLPECFRPTDALYKSFVIPSNTGQSLAGFSFISGEPLPTPSVPGYVLGVSLDGNVTIYGQGTFANLIPPGNQVTLPTEVYYTHEESSHLFTNVKISKGASNITQFTGSNAKNGYRDSHVCDTFNGHVAFSWEENTGLDPTDNTMNMAVAVGKVVKGKLKIGKTTHLTNFQNEGFVPFDTSIAINRKDPNNIVASYALVGDVPPPNNNFVYRAVSFDRGKSWPINGPTNIQPTGNPSVIGDVRGVLSDKYGNIWCCVTNFYGNSGGAVISNEIGQPAFWVSADKGVNFSVAYSVPTTPPFNLGADLYDYPQVAFGGDGNGNYGMWYIVDDETNTLIDDGFDSTSVVGFIPINGPVTVTNIVGSITSGVLSVDSIIDGPSIQVGMIVSGLGVADNTVIVSGPNLDGTWNVSNPTQNVSTEALSLVGNIGPTSDPAFLTNLENALELACLTAAEDGRVWAKGASIYLTAYISDQMLFKSPGAVDSNYVGPWQTHSTNNYFRVNSLLSFFGAPLIYTYSSYPAIGYILESVNSIVFDDSRQALYALTSQNSPDLSQNMRMYLLISRDNGQTWSQPYYIATSDFANRGFQCMALDPIKGNLIFSWYDGRNDPSEQKMEFFGAVLPAKKLDKLVNAIPLSNPLYQSGSQAGTLQAAPTVTGTLLEPAKKKKRKQKHSAVKVAK